MKPKDVALIGVVVFLSVIISVFVSKALFTSKSRQQAVEVVPAISSNFQTPDNHYFNAQAIDPTKLITIGNSANANPFSGVSQ